MSAVDQEESTPSNSNTNKVSKPIQKSLKPLLSCLTMFVLAFVIPVPLHSLLAYLYEYQGENTFNKINNLNYGYFIMNVFNIWATIRFHKLSSTNVILRQRIKSKSDWFTTQIQILFYISNFKQYPSSGCCPSQSVMSFSNCSSTMVVSHSFWACACLLGMLPRCYQLQRPSFLVECSSCLFLLRYKWCYC